MKKILLFVVLSTVPALAQVYPALLINPSTGKPVNAPLVSGSPKIDFSSLTFNITSTQAAGLLTGGSGTLNLSGYTLSLASGQIPNNAANTSGTAAKATADASGNVITATYAPISSPAFTGTPTAPTPTSSDNSTKLATTAFVKTTAGAYVPFTGSTAQVVLDSGGIVLGDGDGIGTGYALFAGGGIVLDNGSGGRVSAQVITPLGTLDLSNFITILDAGNNPGLTGQALIQGAVDGSYGWSSSPTDQSGYGSVDWNARELLASDGATIILHWDTVADATASLEALLPSVHVVSGTFTAGSATVTVPSGVSPWIQDTSGVAAATSVTVSGTTATVKGTGTDTFHLFYWQ